MADLKNQTIAALEIGDFANALVQFYVMHQAGQDFVMDPKAVVFTGTQFLARLESIHSCIARLITRGRIESRRRSNRDCKGGC